MIDRIELRIHIISKTWLSELPQPKQAGQLQIDVSKRREIFLLASVRIFFSEARYFVNSEPASGLY